MPTPFDFRGKLVLITGASSGIGRAFAFEMAKRGAHLLLVARSGEVLQQLAEALRRDYACVADWLALDLARPDAASQLATHLQVRALHVDVLINNAGFATYGRFETVSIKRQCDEIQLNCVTPLALAHLVLPGMQARGHGAIINVASTAAFQPDPYMATYGATKSFVLTFSEALWAENQHTGVRVLALCPGATDTGFFDVVAADEAAVGKRMPVGQVIAEGLSALDGNACSHVVGRQNRLLANLQRVMSRKGVAKLVEKMLRPKRDGALVTQ